MTITTTKEELVMLIEQGIVDEHVYEMKVREYMNAAFLYPFVKTPRLDASSCAGPAEHQSTRRAIHQERVIYPWPKRSWADNRRKD